MSLWVLLHPVYRQVLSGLSLPVRQGHLLRLLRLLHRPMRHYLP
jgi:hypothetical protein